MDRDAVQFSGLTDSAEFMNAVKIPCQDAVSTKWGGASRSDSRFWIFLKSASRLVPDGWVESKSSGDRCHF